jgi:hypothetical protein
MVTHQIETENPSCEFLISRHFELINPHELVIGTLPIQRWMDTHVEPVGFSELANLLRLREDAAIRTDSISSSIADD